MPSSTQSNPPSSPTPKRNTKKPRARAISNNAEEPSKPSKKTKVAPRKTKAATDAELQDDDDGNDADDVAKALEKTPTASAPKKTKNSKKKSVEFEEDDDAAEDSEKIPTIRLPNFTEDKHVQICCSWLETTKDPLNSTNQTGKTFWARVCEHYMKMIPTHNRPVSSIKKSWQGIQRATNKFHGCFKQVNQANQSGTTNNDWLSASLKLYVATKRRPYPHLQCYNILAPLPKWNIYCEQLDKKDQKKNELSSELTVSEVASDTTAVPSTVSGEISRTTGNKKAKEAKVQEAKDQKWRQDLVKAHLELAIHLRNQNEILTKQKEAMITMAEESIMKTDLDSIPESRRLFFEWKQKKVMEKMALEQEREAEEKKKKAEEKKKQEEEEEKKKKEEEEKEKKEEEAKKVGNKKTPAKKKDQPKKATSKSAPVAKRVIAVKSKRTTGAVKLAQLAAAINKPIVKKRAQSIVEVESEGDDDQSNEEEYDKVEDDEVEDDDKDQEDEDGESKDDDDGF